MRVSATFLASGLSLLVVFSCRSDSGTTNCNSEAQAPNHSQDVLAHVKGFNELHTAIITEDRERVADLLALGADVSTQTTDEFQSYPIQLAAVSADPAIIDLLVEHGADLDAGSGKSRPALIISMMHQRDELPASLVAKGASVNVKDDYGQTPLHWAATLGKMELAELFVRHGADVNARDKAAMTPLFHAIMYDHAELVAYLKSKGARIDVKDTVGLTPVSLAKRSENEAIRRIILGQAEAGEELPKANP